MWPVAADGVPHTRITCNLSSYSGIADRMVLPPGEWFYIASTKLHCSDATVVCLRKSVSLSGETDRLTSRWTGCSAQCRPRRGSHTRKTCRFFSYSRIADWMVPPPGESFYITSSNVTAVNVMLLFFSLRKSESRVGWTDRQTDAQTDWV